MAHRIQKKINWLR